MRTRPMRQGLLAGLIAYAAVALFYAAFDLLASRGALYTVNMLGITVFRGVRDTGIIQLPVPLDAMAIFWYNAIHLVLSLTIGVIVLGLVDHAERHPAQGRVVLLVIVAGFLVTIFAVGRLSEPIRAVLPWWSIVAANSAAVIVTAGYVIRRHPRIWSVLVLAGPVPRRITEPLR